MATRNPRHYEGPAFLSMGFRPFFLSAIVFAGGVIPLWLMFFSGSVQYRGTFDPLAWHIHEMLFGYGAAVLAGFLLTAIPNWTGRLPIQGMPLALLCLAWWMGRLAMSGMINLDPYSTLLADNSFLALLLLSAGREVIAGRNWRNLGVVAPATLFLVANLVFHLEASFGDGPDIGRRLGLAVLVFLITLIGGRIIPSFTRNWLSKRGQPSLPAPFGKLDQVSLLIGAAALLAWTMTPEAQMVPVLYVVAAMFHFVRLARWRGAYTLPSPLLAMLHIAYAFVPVGFLFFAFDQNIAAVHLLGIGSIGGMTTAVMIRATLGHTGRLLESGTILCTAFSLIIAAAMIRALIPYTEILGISGISAAGAAWVVGFMLLLWKLAPWLLSARRA